MREYGNAPSPTATHFQSSKLWMLLSYLLYLFLDQMTILIGLKVCGEEGEGGPGGEADGENSGQTFYSLLQKLEAGKTAFLLEYFPQSSPVLVVCYNV